MKREDVERASFLTVNLRGRLEADTRPGVMERVFARQIEAARRFADLLQQRGTCRIIPEGRQEGEANNGR